MASESYIERLQREKKQLIGVIKAILTWHDAMRWAETTGKKGDAYREAAEKKTAMDKELKNIEPLLAEKEAVNA